MYRVLIISLFFAIGFSTPLHASDYSIPEIRVEAKILEDGRVSITEHRTYEFNGLFSWADYRLPKSGFSEIRNIRVSEGDHDYINENSEEPGTFSVSESSRAIIVKWHYAAEDTTRTFTLSYELTEAVVTGNGWSEFFWNFLASGREKMTRTFTARVILPAETSPDSLHAWDYSNHDKLEIRTTPEGYLFTASNLTRRESVEVRTLFPASLFREKAYTVADDGLTLDTVMQAEDERADRIREQAESDAWWAAAIKGFTLLISLVSIGIFILFYQKYGNRLTGSSIPARDTVMIPDPLPPAIIGRLLAGRYTTTQHLTATLFDLARRGWFTIEEKEKEKSLFSTGRSEFILSEPQGRPEGKSEDRPEGKPEGRPEGALLPFEKMLADFAQSRIAAGKNTFDKLFKGTDSEVSKWHTKWKQSAADEFNRQGWIDPESYRGVYWNIGLQIPLAAISVYLIIAGGPTAIIALGVSSLMLASSYFIIRRTPEGEEVYRRWTAYRNGLKDANPETIRSGPSDLHFIYAMAFHLSGKTLGRIIETGGQDQDRVSSVFPWILFLPGSIQTPQSMARSVTTLAASSTTSFAGTSGGGGATAGVSGGGASGGAG